MRSASIAASSVGTPKASSKAETCIVCIPPRAAANISTEVLTTLFIDCWAVSDEPAVKAKIRSFSEAASLGSYFSWISLAQVLRAARNFAISGRNSIFDERNVNNVAAI